MSDISKHRRAEAERLKSFYQAAKTRRPELRQKHIAQELGVTSGTVAGWINGHARCPDVTLVRLGEMLDFDPVVVRPEVHERLQDKSDRSQKLADIQRKLEGMNDSKLSSVKDFIGYLMSTRQ